MLTFSLCSADSHLWGRGLDARIPIGSAGRRLLTPLGEHLDDPSGIARTVSSRCVRSREKPDLPDFPHIHTFKSVEIPRRYPIPEYSCGVADPRASPHGTGAGTKPTRPQTLDGLSGGYDRKVIQLFLRDAVWPRPIRAPALRHRLAGPHQQQQENARESRAHDGYLRSSVSSDEGALTALMSVSCPVQPSQPSRRRM